MKALHERLVDEADAIHKAVVYHGPDASVRGLPALERLLRQASDVVNGGQQCRECGCTDNCACGEGCSWVEPDLCSACTSGLA